MYNEERDWLFVQSGLHGDIGMLFDFLHGKPFATGEIRDAIVRILHSGWDTLGVGKNLISILFDPEQRPKGYERPVWTVDFKRPGKGRSNPWRDAHVATGIQACRDCGRSYEEAIEWAVENFGIGERRAKQIYGEWKDKTSKLTRLPSPKLRIRSVKSDG